MRILAVEDDHRVTNFIARALRAEGFQMDVASDGLVGLDLAFNSCFDVLLLDVSLPDIDGFEVCRRLRGQGDRTPIIILTARDALADKVAGFDAGADDYVTKPFAVEELIARISAHARRRVGDKPGSALEVADLRLDRSSHEVRRAGELVQLTFTEFALLEFLMRAAGRTLTRTAIEQQVWGYDKDPLTNVVDVYIRRLRRKLDTGREPKLIHTVRGVGYQLKVRDP